jgi:hypothetical protein
LVVFGVELWDAEFVGAKHAAALDFGLIPIRPGGTDAGAREQDVDPRPLLHPTLLPLLVDRPLKGLHLAADAKSAL